MPDNARVLYFTLDGKLDITTLKRHQIDAALPLPPDVDFNIVASPDGRTIYDGAQQVEANIWKGPESFTSGFARSGRSTTRRAWPASRRLRWQGESQILACWTPRSAGSRICSSSGCWLRGHPILRYADAETALMLSGHLIEESDLWLLSLRTRRGGECDPVRDGPDQRRRASGRNARCRVPPSSRPRDVTPRANRNRSAAARPRAPRTSDAGTPDRRRPSRDA